MAVSKRLEELAAQQPDYRSAKALERIADAFERIAAAVENVMTAEAAAIGRKAAPKP